MSKSAAAAATAVVLVDGRRKGSAVLVDARHLVTAAHLLRRVVNWQYEPVHDVELVFPAAEAATGQPARVSAKTTPQASDSQWLDAALLEIVEPLPGWLPVPVPLSPARRLPPRVSVFGFPHAEADLRGVWCHFDTAGPTTVGTVQADWARAAGSAPGHSGGPVLDPATGTVVGVLVEGSVEGQFDRFVPASQIADAWPQLPRPWLLTGPDVAAAAEHFRMLACGLRGRAAVVTCFGAGKRR